MDKKIAGKKMDAKIEEKIIELYSTGSGINYISRLFKIKKDRITDLVKDIEVVIPPVEEPKKEEIIAKVSTEVIKNTEIEINLPKEDEDYKTSIKVNKIVMEQFREFAKANKEFTPKDLISMAIVEYMENHK
ncbi:hypothetical protein [uncultured Clostridium sp.]|jgi:ABC-type nitrate/sulfonate/bicarbonate transport system substrate-binding protein|uniref:hypothetical protein n=1 Tax=uncultured Clostridium sp. TaxID=59620 RepID=UPI0026307528|nr:hypothetical protein [uncultured Clostridium sp.]